MSVHSTTPSHVSCLLVCLGLSVNPVQYARANTLTPMFALMVFYFRLPTMTTVLPKHNKLVLYHYLSYNIKLFGLYYFCINPTKSIFRKQSALVKQALVFSRVTAKAFAERKFRVRPKLSFMKTVLL